jgi:hypothetical protein
MASCGEMNRTSILVVVVLPTPEQCHMANDDAAVWQSVKGKTANLMAWIERVTAAATKLMAQAAEAERFLQQRVMLSCALVLQGQEGSWTFFTELRHTVVMAVRSLQQHIVIYANGLWRCAMDENNYTLEAVSREAGRLHEQAKEHCCADIAALIKALETRHLHGITAAFPAKTTAPVAWSEVMMGIGSPVVCAVATAPKELDANGIIEVYGGRVAVAILLASLVGGIGMACRYGYETYCERRVRQDVMRMEHIAADIEALIGSLAAISEAAMVGMKSDALTEACELPDVVQQWSTEDAMTVHVIEEIRETVRAMDTFVRKPIVHFAKDLEAAGVSFRVHLVSTAAGEDRPTTVAWAGLSRRKRTLLQCNTNSRCCTA